MAIVYIAGPMRGHKLYNFPAFDRVADSFESLGHEVVNPADIGRANGFDPRDLPKDFDWEQIPPDLDLVTIVNRDLTSLQQCDTIFMLKGWEGSTGASAELAVAKWLGLEVVFQSPDGDPQNFALGPEAKDSCCRRITPTDQGAYIPIENIRVEDGTAHRDNAGKPELSQLHHFRLDALAAHVSAGRAKYPDRDGRPNWTKGGKPDAEYLDAAERHLAAFVKGEVYDPELRTMHLAAVAWNALACITNNYLDSPAKAN